MTETIRSYRDLMNRNDEATDAYLGRFVPGVDPEADEMRAVDYNADR